MNLLHGPSWDRSRRGLTANTGIAYTKTDFMARNQDNNAGVAYHAVSPGRVSIATTSGRKGTK